MLLSKVKKTIGKYRMLAPGNIVLAAVSGGPDSVCLLSVLQALAKDLDLALHVAHLDHMFRGKESADEAKFVAAVAEQLGIPATVEQFDVPAFCRERGLSSQAGARRVRYEFLARVAATIGAHRIATGHTAGDQAETLIMRLLRGAGVSGLAGIPPVRDKIIRPLLDVTREEVLEYLHQQGLAFVTDPSNLKPVYTRNRVRREIMPVLEQFNPRVIEALASAAAILRDEDEAMEAHLASIAPGILLREEQGVRIGREAFNALLPALRRRMLRMAVDLVAGDEPTELSSLRTEEVLAFASDAPSGRAMDLPEGLALEREYDYLVIGPRKEPLEFSIRLAVPGVTALPWLFLEVETAVLDAPADQQGVTLPSELPSPQERGNKERELSEENYLWQAVFDYVKIALPLFVRSRQRGDRFQPAGMAGKSKKLQDYFVDEKVPRLKRAAVPLLCTEQDIIWVVGMRTDARFLPGPETKRVLFVRIWEGK
ncbi:MAG: tRNA lysidine(34) synthetase TilS [Nitrospirota bacterium]